MQKESVYQNTVVTISEEKLRRHMWVSQPQDSKQDGATQMSFKHERKSAITLS